MTNDLRNIISIINRRLARGGEKLHKTRARWVNDLGRFHIVDERTNHICGRWLESERDLANLLLELSTSIA